MGMNGDTRIPRVIPPPYPEIPEMIEASNATNRRMAI